MIYREHRRLARRASSGLWVTLGLVLSFGSPPSATATNRTPAPWRIESFCHRGASPSHRCLVRARKGIIVFPLVELPSPPSVRWEDGVAVLTSGANGNSRQLRFYEPPQKISAPLARVRAYDTRQQLVAFDADGRLHLRAMFAGSHDLATLALPADIRIDTLQVRFDGGSARASWRGGTGQAQTETVPVGH